MSRDPEWRISIVAALLLAGTAWAQVPTVVLSPTERVGDAAVVNTALPGFKIKTVLGPAVSDGNNPLLPGNLYWSGMNTYSWANLEAWANVPRNFIEFLGDANPAPVTAPTVNFTNDGSGTQFPGVPAGGEQFGVRAEGFVVLPTGTHRLGLDATDQGYLWIGSQAVASSWYDTTIAPPGTPQVFDLVVTSPGTYPIRVEVFHQTTAAPTDTPHAHLYYVTDDGNADVGTGDLRVYQALLTGTYAWRSHGVIIPASRKVADNGQGGELGWNATLSLPGGTAAWPPAFNGGHGLTVSENDLGGLTTTASQVTQTPLFLNYSRPDIAPYSYNGRFYPENQNSLMDFTNYAAQVSGEPTYVSGSFAIAADGYIEFPAPGDYGLNTTTRDACSVWIGGQIVQCWYGDYDNVDGLENAKDRVPTCVHVDTAGIYDIRVQFCNHTYFPLLTFFQYLPDGTAALVNTPTGSSTPRSTVSVYRTLSGGDPASIYHNPVRLPLSAKAAELNAPGLSGLRAQFVKYTPASGDTNLRGGVGHDSFWSLPAIHDLLASALDHDPSAELRQQGTVVFDGIVPALDFGDPDYFIDSNPDPWPSASIASTDAFGARFTGHIGLKAGGHCFALFVNDAADVTIGGLNVARFGTWRDQSAWTVFYVWAPAEGMYPIEINYGNFNEAINGYNEAVLRLVEVDVPVTTFGNWVNVAPNVSTLRVLCSTPFADADQDGDVDQADFGTFQNCFTGGASGGQLPTACACFDRDGNGDVSSTDLTGFIQCFTGPSVRFNAQAPPPGCAP